MPMNIVEVDGKEFFVPDSWMHPLMAYLELVKEKTKEEKEKGEAESQP